MFFHSATNEGPIEDSPIDLEYFGTINKICLSIEKLSVAEITIQVSVGGENFYCEPRNPICLSVQNTALPLILVRICRDDITKPWSVSYQYNWVIGIEGSSVESGLIYRLPFPLTSAYKITQGHGQGSHDAPADRYALDFGMPLGSTVCAAQAGMVIAVRANSTFSGLSKEFGKLANYVVIKHSDGTYAEYYHLLQNSVRVSVNEVVQAGTPLAQSGNSGFSTGPHLHFGVFKIENMQKRSVPVKFQTSKGIISVLEKDVLYGH